MLCCVVFVSRESSDASTGASDASYWMSLFAARPPISVPEVKLVDSSRRPSAQAPEASTTPPPSPGESDAGNAVDENGRPVPGAHEEQQQEATTATTPPPASGSGSGGTLQYEYTCRMPCDVPVLHSATSSRAFFSDLTVVWLFTKRIAGNISVLCLLVNFVNILLTPIFA